MNTTLLYPEYGSSETEEISRYFRRSDAILSELRASRCSPDDDEAQDASAGSSAPPPTKLSRPNPGPQPLVFHPRLISDQETEEDCLSNIAVSLEELRLEGACNPFQEDTDDQEQEISEAMQQFLHANAPTALPCLIKPVPLRVSDMICLQKK